MVTLVGHPRYCPMFSNLEKSKGAPLYVTRFRWPVVGPLSVKLRLCWLTFLVVCYGNCPKWYFEIATSFCQRVMVCVSWKLFLKILTKDFCNSLCQ